MAYSVQDEAEKLLLEGIINNPLLSGLPADVVRNVSKVKFIGSPSPSIPIPWRFAESISALKGLESAFINTLLIRKYNKQPANIEINATKDGGYYHIHGSLNPDPTITALGLPFDRETKDYDDSCAPYIEKAGQLNSGEIDSLMNDKYRQAGTICWTKEEYAASEHGKANAHVGLYQLHHVPNDAQPACWWSDTSETSPERPLSGLKVVDLTRIIAAPTITRGLAELGASVMRVTTPHIADLTTTHVDLNWGKWNSKLDLRQEEDREKLKALILDADVVVEGYRPGIMAKYGFGKEDILKMCAGRDRGIIHVRENCYGWQGPWMGRSGWQQISDACCGVSMEFGRAMGNDEAVTPILPNSDYCTGVIGICAVLNALLERGEKGGSYAIDVALNYYSQWLVNSCGTYPPDVWEALWAHHGKPVFRHYHNMVYTIPELLMLLAKNSASALFQPSFFEIRESKAVNTRFKTLKPILNFEGNQVRLGYNVGTRSNWVDKPVWPEDLQIEVIA
ncbi:hypothetical protein B7463_g3302, partial [Scytalidium lignicola]